MSTFPDRRTRRRQSTKEEILTAAVELMERDGVAGMSLSAVARSVGMKPPSLYEYFPSKNAIYDALFERGAFELRSAVLAAGSDPRHAEVPLAAIRAGAHAYVTWSLANPVAAQLLNWRPVPGFEPSPGAFAASRDMVEDLRTLLALAVRQGWLDPAAAGDDALLLFISVIAGVVSQQLANEPAADPASGRFSRLVDPAVTMWLEHYAQRQES